MNRLPANWSEEKHKCDLPFTVYFDVFLGDVFTCPSCGREWRVYSTEQVYFTETPNVSHTNLGFKLVSDCRDTQIMRMM